MWIAILGIVGEVIKFLCAWGLHWMDDNAARKKVRQGIYEDEIKTSTNQRDLFLAITRYNGVR